MPVIGSGNHHRVYIAAVENLSILQIIGCRRRELLFGCQAARLVDVTDGHQFIAAIFRKTVQQPLHAPAGSNGGDTDPVVRPQHPGLRERGGRAGC